MISVSTRAPARGATGQLCRTEPTSNRFNSRAREGRDKAWQALTPGRSCFNSRAREGRDVEPDPTGRVIGRVSTRAPARGATGRPSGYCSHEGCFNSRAREGRDSDTGIMLEKIVRFNSRAREGRDGHARGSAGIGTGFNSRAREGRDLPVND